jgi:hypothetical protein
MPIGYTREDGSFEEEKELLYDRAKSVAIDRKVIKPADGARPLEVIKY